MRRKTHLSINHICFFLGLVLWMAAIGSSIAVLLMTGNVAATLCVLGFGAGNDKRTGRTVKRERHV